MESNPPQTQALPSGTRLEEFVIERVLGSGGFGITYLARDTRLDRQVVIKENLPAQFCFRDTHSLTVAARLTHGEDADNFRWSLENFSREAAMLASLDHPGIVKVLRSFEVFGTACFVMPYLEGLTFDELIASRQDKGQVFSEDELRGFVYRVLGALGYLHDRGVYHRDIKPGNLLVTLEGMPVLIDFGSARQRLSERSMTVIESAGYTPFEQLQSRGNVGPWSDLYALGATLEKALTGQAPPKTMDRMRRDPRVSLANRPGLQEAFTPVFLRNIDKALEVDDADRWQNALEWNAALTLGKPGYDEVPALGPSIKGLPKPKFAGTRAGEERDYEIAPGVTITMCWIPPGRFIMGSSVNEFGRREDEIKHPVEITLGFWMAKTAVTQAQWMAVVGSNPSRVNATNLPVEQVSWNDTQTFFQKLNDRLGNADGGQMVLPTEAQWEYAAAAGRIGVQRQLEIPSATIRMTHR
jgi:serine/threonine protein kinase